ncbi:hypothetical protein PYW07_002629 [Mythimna separata]|uniref:Uncharacterized protein n=1 Tax=Mythimna separata TaxID=271217 RepID=A0AAD7YG82_MYTSE|nr:hypothetical protein PYW07_002629 [Mythimna separata]
MKPLALSIGYVVVVLMVHVSGEERLLSEDVMTFSNPYYFNYTRYDQIILFDIILKNISPSVTKIYVIYSGRLNLTATNWTQDKIRVDKEVINGAVTIPLRRNLLQYQHILIDVELETTEGLCSKSKVIEGRLIEFSHVRVVTNCQPPNICEMVIDLHNQCKEIDMPHLFFLTETQIRCPPDAAYLNYPGYSLEHHFLQRARVCVYVRNDICCQRLRHLEDPLLSTSWLLVDTGMDKIVYACVCAYRSHSGDQETTRLFDHLSEAAESHMALHRHPDAQFVDLGDFSACHQD